jgi:deoxyribonuclease V
VAYRDRERSAHGAAIAFDGWEATGAIWEGQLDFVSVAPYEPGAFYRRELPCWLALLESARAAGIDPDILIVDGYATFGAGRPALGAHLHDRSGKIVIGVAKTPFATAEHYEVLRGRSKRPLYVTSVGIDPRAAADLVRVMHGPDRIPTLLARVDALARIEA